MTRYMAERDSIMQENVAKTQQLDELNDVLTVIAIGLDSIAVQEHFLLTNKSRDGVKLDKRQIAANLKSMANLLAEQREKLRLLQDSLENRKSVQGMAHLQRVVEFLNHELDEKDRAIQRLRADLNKSRKDVSRLQASLTETEERADEAEKKAETLTTALSVQDNVINECYVKVGTKKQLAASGLLKGGFLKKRKIDYENMDKSKFIAVDIRKFREVTLNSDNPRILTPQPSSQSYYIEKSGNGTCTLAITDPTLFWSVSNFLIIQL